MRSLKRLAPIVVSLAFVIPHAVLAQGIQNWINNEVNKINSDAAGGIITGGQAQQLDARAAQLQQQEQMYAAQNGGRLTGGEAHQIARELHGLNHGINRDIHRDAQAASGYGMPGGALPGIGGIPGGLPPGMTPQMYWTNLTAQQANWTLTQQQAWAAQNPALAAQLAQWQAARQAQYGPNGYHHHHHHDRGDWGAQYGGGGGGYWNH